MSLKRALEKLRSDGGKETQQHLHNVRKILAMLQELKYPVQDVVQGERAEHDTCNLKQQLLYTQGDGKFDPSEFIDDFDFDLNSDFFEQDEYFSTPVNKEAQLSHSRVPLMQVCNKTTVTNDRPDQEKNTVTPLSSQKLKTFAFSRSKLKDVDKPPPKRLALEKNLSTHRTPISSSSSLNTSSNIVVPHITDTSPIGPSTVTLASSSSHSTPTCHSVTTCSSSHHISSPTTPLSSRPPAKRKFPGPAGLLPKLLPNQSMDDVNLSVADSPGFTPRSKVTTLAELLPSSQGEGCDFTGAVWKFAMEELPSIAKGYQDVFSVTRLTKEASHKRLVLGKVPFLVAMLKSVVPQGNGACVVLKDPTGEIPGTLHARVYEAYQKEMVPGTVLTLQKVSVFSPSQRRKYLNITPSNIIKLYMQTGSTVVNEQAVAEIDTASDVDAAHSSVTNGAIVNPDMFNIDDDWCGANPSTISDFTDQVTLNTSKNRSCAPFSNSFIPTTVSNTVVTCGDQRDSNNGIENHSAMPQFTDGLEDEDLDKLMQDFEEDQLICT